MRSGIPGPSSATATSTSSPRRRVATPQRAALLAHGVNGVHHQVDERHLELVRDAEHARQVGLERLLERDAAARDLVVAQLEAALDDVVERERRHLLAGGPAEGEQAVGERADAVGAARDRGQHLALGPGELLHLEQLEVAHDVGERRVELVGDARRHLADGGELLRLQQLLLRLLQLLDRVLLALEELRVLDRERGVARQRLGRAQARRR